MSLRERRRVDKNMQIYEEECSICAHKLVEDDEFRMIYTCCDKLNLFFCEPCLKGALDELG